MAACRRTSFLGCGFWLRLDEDFLPAEAAGETSERGFSLQQGLRLRGKSSWQMQPTLFKMSASVFTTGGAFALTGG